MPPADNSPTPPNLFSEVPAGMMERLDHEVLLDAFGTRARAVRPDVGIFRRLEAEAGAFDVTLNLFEDVEVVASLQPEPAPSPDARAWAGRLKDDESSSVTFVTREGVTVDGGTVTRSEILMGSIRSDSLGLFQVAPLAGTQLHVVRAIDDSRLPPCGSGPEEAPDVHDALPAPGVDPQSRDDGSIVDVLVVYTSAARQGAGSDAAIRTTIDLAILETNQAYARSDVQHRIRLMYMGEVRYNESAAGNYRQMLDDLRGDGNGHIDEVHRLRDFYGADLVAMIVERRDFCGIAYLMQNPVQSFERWGFSVTSRGCATGSYTFGHELGHNMGCCHDADNADSDCVFDYAYGWRFRAGGQQYRTIMAYSPGRRLQNFSNPRVWFEGERTGSFEEADNARTMNDNAPVVAKFRREQDPVPDLYLSRDMIRFGTVHIGEERTLTFRLKNFTEKRMTFSIDPAAPPFSWSPTRVTMDHGTVRTVRVTFRPTAQGVRQATLRIRSAAASSPHTVTVNGMGIVDVPVPPPPPNGEPLEAETKPPAFADQHDEHG